MLFYTSFTGQPSRSAAVRSWVTKIVGRAPASRFVAATASATSSASMAGEGFIQQQRGSILAEQRPQQGNAALLPTGEPCSGQGQFGIGKAQAAQLPLCLLR